MVNDPNTRPVAIITGASSGIGRAVARQLARRGYNLFLVALEIDRLLAVAEDLRAFSTHVQVYQGDVADTAEGREIADQAIAAFDRIDVLVNAAGYAVYGPFETMDLHDLTGQILTNCIGTMSTIKYCLPHLKITKGVIVNIASTAGLVGIPRLASYSASKHAVVGLSEALRYELEGTGVSVCVIAPGKVKTNIFSHPSFAGVRWAHDGSGITPEAAALEICRAIARRTHMLILPRSRRIAMAVRRLLPYFVVSRALRQR